MLGVKKSFKTEESLGCSIDNFKNYIESLFLEGMNWDNRSDWHIDHIIPISLAQDENEIIVLSNYRNLRPLWSKDNIRKSNYIDLSNPIYLNILEYRDSIYLKNNA